VKEKKAKKELKRRRDHGMRSYVDEFFGWRIQVLFGLPDTWYVSRAGPSKDYIRRDIWNRPLGSTATPRVVPPPLCPVTSQRPAPRGNDSICLWAYK